MKVFNFLTGFSLANSNILFHFYYKNPFSLQFSHGPSLIPLVLNMCFWQCWDFGLSLLPLVLLQCMCQWPNSALVQMIVWCQAITITNADLLSVGPIGTKFSEMLIKIKNFKFMNTFENVGCKMAPILSRGEMELIIPHPRYGQVCRYVQWPLLLTWINFNPSMDK